MDHRARWVSSTSKCISRDDEVIILLIVTLHLSERGLMFVETYLSGHMEPEFQPRVSLQHIKWLLGRIEKL